MMKFVLAAALLATGGAAQAAGPCGDGTIMTVRESKLTATGTKAGLMEAFADHKAWYAKAGLKDQLSMGPVLEPAKGGMRASDTAFVSVHVYASSDAPKHDAAWDAYVAKYKANSSISSELRFCLPKGSAMAVK